MRLPFHKGLRHFAPKFANEPVSDTNQFNFARPGYVPDYRHLAPHPGGDTGQIISTSPSPPGGCAPGGDTGQIISTSPPPPWAGAPPEGDTCQIIT